jgi:hypothetical protein
MTCNLIQFGQGEAPAWTPGRAPSVFNTETLVTELQ